MAKVGIVMGSDSDMPIMAKAADILEELGIEYEMTIISAHREPDVFFDYSGCRNGSAFAGNVCGNFPDAGNRNSHAHNLFRRKRFPVFYRADAVGNTGCHSCDKWRSQCGTSCSEDSCYFG